MLLGIERGPVNSPHCTPRIDYNRHTPRDQAQETGCPVEFADFTSGVAEQRIGKSVLRGECGVRRHGIGADAKDGRVSEQWDAVAERAGFTCTHSRVVFGIEEQDDRAPPRCPQPVGYAGLVAEFEIGSLPANQIEGPSVWESQGRTRIFLKPLQNSVHAQRFPCAQSKYNTIHRHSTGVALWPQSIPIFRQGAEERPSEFVREEGRKAEI